MPGLACSRLNGGTGAGDSGDRPARTPRPDRLEGCAAPVQWRAARLDPDVIPGLPIGIARAPPLPGGAPAGERR